MEKGIKNKNRVNWRVVEELLDEKGYSKAYVSTLMGLSSSWVSNYIREDRKTNTAQLMQLSTILGVDKEKLLMSESTQEETANAEMEIGFEPSQFEIDVLEMLKAIKQKVDADHEILMYLFNKKQSESSEEKTEEKEEEPIDELDVSMAVLKEFLDNRTAVKYETFKDEAMKKGVTDIQYIEAAISKLGHHKMTRGYGNSKTVWIYRQGDING